MKRGIAALFILMACVVFAVSVNFTLEHKVQSLHSVAITAANDKNKVYILEDKWKNEVVYFKFFMDHEYFENIDKKIKKLPYLNGEAYRNLSRETVIDLIELKEHLSFSLSNIF